MENARIVKTIQRQLKMRMVFISPVHLTNVSPEKKSCLMVHVKSVKTMRKFKTSLAEIAGLILVMKDRCFIKKVFVLIVKTIIEFQKMVSLVLINVITQKIKLVFWESVKSVLITLILTIITKNVLQVTV